MSHTNVPEPSVPPLKCTGNSCLTPPLTGWCNSWTVPNEYIATWLSSSPACFPNFLEKYLILMIILWSLHQTGCFNLFHTGYDILGKPPVKPQSHECWCWWWLDYVRMWCLRWWRARRLPSGSTPGTARTWRWRSRSWGRRWVIKRRQGRSVVTDILVY